MNLSVNLIQRAELRSASLVSLRAIGYMTALILPLAILLLFADLYLERGEQQSRQQLLESEQQALAASLAAARTTLAEQKRLQQAYDELTGWQRSRAPWPTWLSWIRDSIPARIQLQSWQSRQTLRADEELASPVRQIEWTLAGRCVGSDAEAVVQELRRTLADHAAIETARVTAFMEDPAPNADPEDRIFELTITAQPISFKQEEQP